MAFRSARSDACASRGRSQATRDSVTIFFTRSSGTDFHADVHPGNIQVSLESSSFGRYVSLDFGIIGTLTGSTKEYLAQNFRRFPPRLQSVSRSCIESGWVPAGTPGGRTRVGDPQRLRPLFRPPLTP